MPDGSNFPRPRLPRRRRPVEGQWPLDDGITVVLFAGLGGACDGLEAAGFPVAVANNHDDVALAAHAARHPHTRHIRGDIFDVDPLKATGGRPVKILWASPDCTDHSVAKGAAPRSPRVRSLPWQVCRWAGTTRAEVIFVENVREIRGWGPLVASRCKKTGRVLKADGTVAAKGERVPVAQQLLVRDKARAGRSFRRWKAHLQGLGYAYDDRDLCCADFGIPTSRRRFFAVARRDGAPIRFPVATHAPRAKAAALGLLPWASAASIIDWSVPVPSIFGRDRPLVEATQRRIAVGLKRYVIDNPAPFLIPVTHSSSPNRAHSGLDPLPTLTTASGGEMAVVAPTLIQVGYGERPGQVRTLDLDEPIGTQVGANKFALVAAWMVQHNTGLVGHPMEAPVSTMTCGVAQQQVAVAYLAHLRGASTALDAAGPAPTLTTGGGHVAIVAAFLQQYYSQGTTSQAADVPLATVTTVARFSVVTVTIAGTEYAIADIGMRMLTPDEAARAHGLTLPASIDLDGKRRGLTKREAMRLIGNSVPRRMAELLAAANVTPTLAVARPSRRAA